MKAKKIIIIFLICSILVLSLNMLKVGAVTAQQRSKFNILREGNISQFIVFSFSTGGQTAETGQEDFLKVTFDDIDQGQTTVTLLKTQYNAYDYFDIYDNANNLKATVYPGQFYLINFIPGQGDTIEFYKLEYNTNGNLEVDNKMFEIYSPYDWSELVSTATVNYELHAVYSSQYYQGGSGFNVGYLNSILASELSIDFQAEAYSDGFNDGYNTGYNTGYDDGAETVTPFNYAWAFLSGIFSSLGAILSIELIPHVPIGLFFLIPLFFGGVGLILWIWRRN